MTTEQHQSKVSPAHALMASDHRVRDAVRIVATLEGTDEPAALESLRATAERAGVGVGEIVRGVLLFHGDRPVD